MPKKGRSNLGRNTSNAVKAKKRRLNETPEETEKRLADMRVHASTSRQEETPEQRDQRLADMRVHASTSRQEETPQQAEQRRAADAEAHAARFRQQQEMRPKGKWGNAAFNYNSAIDYSSDDIVYPGRMSVECPYCHALKWKRERPGLCCNNGKVKLPLLIEPPAPLMTLLTEDSTKAKDFRKHIRKYNSAFQMTSFGCQRRVVEDNFFPTFKVQGQVYHYIGSLLPVEGSEHSYLQMYFMGNSDDEVERRCSVIPNVQLDRDIIEPLQNMLHANNTYVQNFKMAVDNMQLQDHRVHIRANKTPAGQHAGRFNAPTVNEVAVVIAGQEFGKRDIILQKRNNQLQRVSETHRSYDPLQYPLLFVSGDDGYSIDVMQTNPVTGNPAQKKVSAMTFYAHRMMVRANSTNHLLLSGALFNQYMVDMFAKIESERLQWVRNNQTDLRAENYGTLKDMLAQDKDADDIGKPVILPSTFTGSPRYMHERTQDAMAYVRRHGRPDIFLTMTCSTAWREITDELMAGQPGRDRHDLIARVFHMKARSLVDLIQKKGVFGEMACFMYTVEWQKRGLCHLHCLIWIKGSIPSSAIDSFISAEIPDPEEDPVLFNIVKDKMIHGPCGPLNPKSPCMKNGKCTKHYPREFVSETQHDVDGYPLYRRRKPEDGGRTLKLKIRSTGVEYEVDNRWIVPYCPLISKTFAAHINVELCSSIKSIKYICKYIHKGSDQAVFAVQGNDNSRDEVEMYQTGRYISTNEAIWRILEFPIHEHFPPVQHLTVHLEGGQRVRYNKDNVEERVKEPPKTTLLAFFELCQKNTFAQTLLYVEVPEYFCWDVSSRSWKPRKQGKPVENHPDVKKSATVGRVYTVNPIHHDCFCLRLLLHFVRGPTSYEYLKTVDGRVCETFQEACVLHGLLEDDNHWHSTLEEAAASISPNRLRNLFAIMLHLCGIGEPMKLWESHREQLSEDILYRAKKAQPAQQIDFNDDIFNEALLRIQEKVFYIGGKELQSYGLPRPRSDQGDRLSRHMLRETNYDIDELAAFVDANEPLLVADQRAAYDQVLAALQAETGGLMFLDAPGGTGKTFLLRLLLSRVRQERKVALAVASSGIAATLLPGGRTAHSTFKLPLNIAHKDTPESTISRGTEEAAVFKHCSLIVWDECTMSHRHALEHVDCTLQDIRENQTIFGGVLILLAGDFRQILPVIPRGTPADELSASLKASYLWRHVNTMRLQTNMRAHLTGDPASGQFSDNLLRIGNGELQNDDEGHVIFPDNFVQMVRQDHDLQFAVYPELAERYKNLDWLQERAILAPRNDSVNEINWSLQNMLPSAEVVYNSIDTVVDRSESVEYPTEFLNSLNPAGLPPHKLKLKKGTPVMMLRNIDPPKLCNGTRLVVKNLMPNVIEATILSGEGRGEAIFIPRIPMIPSDLPFEFKRLQFPLKVCFAMTINKAQGQSLKVVGLHLEKPCFSHGQLYVGCSRVGKADNLYIYAPDGKTKNIVYPRIL